MTEADTAANHQPMRLLLVEDNPGDVRLVEAHLAESDLTCELSHAASLKEASDSVGRSLPDLCLLDLGLPDSTGMETVKRFHGVVGDVPLVVLTGLADAEAGVAAIRAGADEYLAKDEITPGALARTVRFVLERRQAREERRKAEEKWSKLFMGSPVAHVVSEARTSRLVEVNDAFQEIFGQDHEEMLGESALEMGHWENPERRRELIVKVEAEGSFRGEEAWFRDAQGNRGRMLLACRRLTLSGEDHLLWTVQDVTARVEAERWRHLLESSVEAAAHGILITDRYGKIVWVNAAFTEMTGYERDEVLGENPRILRSGEQDEAFYEDLWSTILRGETWRGEIVNRREDGTLYAERQSIVPVRHQGRDITHFIAIKEDISERKARQQRLEETTNRLSGLLDTAAGIIYRIRLSDMGMTYVTPNVEEVSGYPPERWTDEPTFWMTLVPDEDLERILSTVETAVRTGHRQVEEEYRLLHADGSHRWYRSVVRFEYDDSAEPIAFVGTAIDVTERQELEQQLRYQALHDPLTDLANRILLADRLEQAVARARRHAEGIALLMLDLRRFKQINESLGHTAGDRVLVEMARRLENAVRGEDTVARWGGDEFLLLLTGLKGRQGLMRARARLLDQIQRRVGVMDRDFTLDVAMGAVLVGLPDEPDAVDAGHPEDLVRYADRALRQATERPGTTFHLYRPEVLEPGASDPLAREQELRRGLEAEEFEPFYQPIVSLESGEAWGLEALARWRHPERGLVGPGEFIDLAEETGLIHELGRQIVARACRQLGRWDHDEGLRLMLNVSGRQFDDERLIGWIEDGLKAASLAPERVMVEVTETSIMRATQKIEELRKLGVGVVIDDFGTGYSSLLYLRDLPVEGLKIDMSFIQGLGRGRGNSAIVETTLTLGRTMDLVVIAEGIESEGQLRLLRQMGCELGQGYLFARPVPADEMDAALASGREVWPPTMGGP